MFFIVLALALAVLAGAYFLKRVLPQYATAIQRSWLVRVSLFACCALLLLAVVLMPLPNKHRLVALVPIFFLVTAFIRIFKSGKARVGSSGRTPQDLDHRKRMN